MLLYTHSVTSKSVCFDKNRKADWPGAPLLYATAAAIFPTQIIELSDRALQIKPKFIYIPQNITSICYFGASDDQTIRIRKFFEEIGL